MGASSVIAPRIHQALADYLKRDVQTIRPDQALREDMGLDSMATIELLFRIDPQVGATTNVFLAVRAGTAAVRHVFLTQSFNRAAPLSFAVFANHVGEAYRFHGFGVEVSRDE